MDYSDNYISENFLELDEVLNETYIGDNNYFYTDFVDKKFSEIKDIEDENEKSKKAAILLYDIIQNISASCCKSVSLKDLYLSNYKYNHVILKSCDKYLDYVKEDHRKKVRKAIDTAFKGDWRDGLVKGAVSFVVDCLVPREFDIVRRFVGKYCGKAGAAVFALTAEKYGKSKANKIGHKVAEKSMKLSYPLVTDLIRSIPKETMKGIFFEICPAKFKSIGEALTIYKKSSQSDTFGLKDTTDGAKFCFDVTSMVMEDIIKVYRKL